MAGLGALKRTMSFTIILVFAIFLGLIFVVSFFFLDPFQGLVLAIVGSVFIILFQYAIGPVIVRATRREPVAGIKGRPASVTVEYSRASDRDIA